MNTPWVAPIVLAAVCAVLAGCASFSRAGREQSPPPVVLVGELERAAIEQAVPRWVDEQATAEVDAAAAGRLMTVPTGAQVSIFLGTWCGDSRRELGRFWRALDDLDGPVAFEVEYIGVDRDKEEPVERTAGRDIRYVPTFIVERDGREVGRIVESAPGGVEADLADLLSGAREGVVTGRTDLEPDT